MAKKSAPRKVARVFMGLIAVAVALGLVAVLQNRVIEIDMNGVTTVQVQYGNHYVEKNTQAYERGSIFPFIKRTISYRTKSNVNEKKLGTYTVIYTASNGKSTVSRKRVVKVVDTQAPRIILKSSSETYTLPGHTYEEEGYKAIDNYDGDVTNKVSREEKDGKVYYRVEDSHHNKSTATRKIVYDDRQGPQISLAGGAEVTWYQGVPFTDSYTATDDLDGDVTAHVKVTGSVDVNTVGTYTLKYEVSDAHGNTTTATRTVSVKPYDASQNQKEDAKTIHLTFDDGPSPYTQKLLDILAKYSVKATFFTTSIDPRYASMIAQEYKAGHTVCVHTYSHQYQDIYGSTDAFWTDFTRQQQVIQQQTGIMPTMFRFPGGSSNTVSANYSRGVMHQLAAQAALKGYVYFDWNVSSGDAGGTTDTNQVYNNVVSQVSQNSAVGKPSVVLQHDTKEFSINAVERIIQWGMQNGYHFSALTSGSYTAHHGIAN